MATHDYDIANQSGAAFRTDLNNALAAIQSNNSNSSSPATTVAYQWWADTTNGILKIRNSSNNDWVELLQLDGTLTLEDGSVSTPGLAFRDDLNTGIFSSAADTFNVATGGVERMELGATTIFNESGADVDFRIEGDTEANLFYVDAGNDRIGIGTSSPDNLLHLFESSTTQTADASSQLVIEKNSNSGITILSGNVHNGRILFGDSGDNDIGQIDYDHNSNYLRFVVNGSESLRIDSSGNIAIGLTSPAGVLHVKGSDIVQYVDSSNAAAEICFRNNTSTGDNIRIGGSGNNLTFDTGGSEVCRFDSDGDCGIGTTSPSARLDVLRSNDNNTACIITNNGTTGGHGLKISSGGTGVGSNVLSVHKDNQSGNDETFRVDGAGNKFLDGNNTTTDANKRKSYFTSTGQQIHARNAHEAFIVFQKNDGTQIGSIARTVSNVAYNTSSDYRLKENVSELSNGITRLKQLKPSRFNFISDPDITMDGFIAHEVSSVVPEAIEGEKDGVITQAMLDAGTLTGTVGDPIYQGIDQSKLVPLLVAAVQELITKVETLEAA